MKNATLIFAALLQFIAPAATILGAAVMAGSDGGSHVTDAEMITACVSSVLVAAGVAASGSVRHEQRREHLAAEAVWEDSHND